ncbi:hypothetical protein IU403_05940 [Aerococcaceae bacterium zg-BR22]|uniref:hypothetical protein n=1 Tax=Aerococcaceae bacterium zg-1292 TaxID=2774330 RepID=UPI0040649C2E|nr:hypothetical protein [Aerococcaceae bacterium zg-BR22]
MAMNGNEIYISAYNTRQLLLMIDDMLQGIEIERKREQEEPTQTNLNYLLLELDRCTERIAVLVDVSIQEMKKIEEQCKEI